MERLGNLSHITKLVSFQKQSKVCLKILCYYTASPAVPEEHREQEKESYLTQELGPTVSE